MHSSFPLDRLGWSAFYSQQLSLEDLSAGYPARVSSVQRSLVTVLCERGVARCRRAASPLADSAVAIGDWLLIEREAPRVLRVLERRSLISRMAAGIEQRMQAIAANLDTLLVVTSCNDDFNLCAARKVFHRRAARAGRAVIVLTKADLCADVEAFVAQTRSIARDIAVLPHERNGTRRSRRARSLARTRADSRIRRLLRRRQVDARQHAARERRAGDQRHTRARCQRSSHDDVATDVRVAVGRMGDRHAGHARAQARCDGRQR